MEEMALVQLNQYYHVLTVCQVYCGARAENKPCACWTSKPWSETRGLMKAQRRDTDERGAVGGSEMRWLLTSTSPGSRLRCFDLAQGLRRSQPGYRQRTSPLCECQVPQL